MRLVAIRSIRHGGLRRFFEHGDTRRVPQDRLSRIAGILAKLDNMAAIADMNQHDYRLHPLKGDRKGYWSVRVSANWRITFRFEHGAVFDVDLLDFRGPACRAWSMAAVQSRPQWR